MTEEELYIGGGKRCALEDDDGSGWWVAVSPRNGYGAIAEGPWEDWVRMAARILVREGTNRGYAIPGWIIKESVSNWYD